MAEPFVSGFAAMIGRPNVGKSTLLNALIGQKVAIISDKPQTTRNRIVGVLNAPNTQIIFLDTPGIHKPQHRLGHFMNRVAEHAIPDVDVVLFVVDGSTPPGSGDRFVAQRIAESGQKCILVVNKTDLVRDKGTLFATLDAYKGLGEYLDVVPISALNQTHLPELVALIRAQLEPGPQYYPEDTITDQPERLVVAELVREKILQLTREEIPHSVAVDVEEMLRRDNGVVFVRATIWVERDSQKGIIIGQAGNMLKEIGQLARHDIEGQLGSRSYLEIFVKVRKDWRNSEGNLRSLGYWEG